MFTNSLSILSSTVLKEQGYNETYLKIYLSKYILLLQLLKVSVAPLPIQVTLC